MAAATKTISDIGSGFRKTDAGMQLGKMLFDGDLQSRLTSDPFSISNLLKKAGIPVPRGVIVAADSAQLFSAGGAFVDAVDEAENINALVCPIVGVMRGLENLLSSIGLLPKNAPAVQVTELGLTTALVVSSGGLNVLADLALIGMLIGGLFFGKDERPEVRARLHQENYDKANQWFKTETLNEKTAASLMFSEYQSGKIGVFQMIENVARVAPYLFSNYFPEISSFIPPTIAKIIETSSMSAKHGGFLGVGRKTSTETETDTFIYSTTVASHTRFQEVFIEKFLEIPWAPYRQIYSVVKSQYQKKLNRRVVVWPKINPLDLAVLSLLPPYVSQFDNKVKLSKLLSAMNLTPHDMGYDIISDANDEGLFLKEYVPPPPALSINGVDYFNDGEIEYQSRAVSLNAENRLAQESDLNGDTDNFYSVPDAVKIVDEFGDLIYPNITDTSYKEIKNYWGVIALKSQMKKDGYFTPNAFSRVSDIPESSDVESRHRNLQFLSHARILNNSARQNIANYFGEKDFSKIKFAPLEKGKLARIIKPAITVRT